MGDDIPIKSPAALPPAEVSLRTLGPKVSAEVAELAADLEQMLAEAAVLATGPPMCPAREEKSAAVREEPHWTPSATPQTAAQAGPHRIRRAPPERTAPPHSTDLPSRMLAQI